MKMKAVHLPWPIGDCIQVKQNVHRIECGIVIASYLLSKPKKLRKGDQERIVDGLRTAHGMLDRMEWNVPEELKPAVKKTRSAVARALTVAKNTPMPPVEDSRLKLTSLVAKAWGANGAMEMAANNLCKKGRGREGHTTKHW